MTMANIPILTDTEAETSMEHDGEIVQSRINNPTYNATKSLFDITLDNLDEQTEHPSADFKDYETRLRHETKDWKSLLYNAYNDLKQSKQKHPTVDKTILPFEKRKYLENAPCLQNFIRESIQFRRKAHEFIDLDYAELTEMLENFEGFYEQRLQIVKDNKIKENLANTQKLNKFQ